MHISGALRDLVLFVQFKRREKHPWSTVTFSLVNTPPWLFLSSEIANGAKSRKAPHCGFPVI